MPLTDVASPTERHQAEVRVSCQGVRSICKVRPVVALSTAQAVREGGRVGNDEAADVPFAGMNILDEDKQPPPPTARGSEVAVVLLGLQRKCAEHRDGSPADCSPMNEMFDRSQLPSDARDMHRFSDVVLFETVSAEECDSVVAQRRKGRGNRVSSFNFN